MVSGVIIWSSLQKTQSGVLLSSVQCLLVMLVINRVAMVTMWRAGAAERGEETIWCCVFNWKIDGCLD